MLSLRLALGALCVAAIVFAYQFGVRRGGEQAVVAAQQQQVLETANEAVDLGDKVTGLQTELANATQELAINNATIDQLKKELMAQGKLSFDESRELSLYRQIEQASKKSGLAVDSLKIVRDESNTPVGLMFTLLQYQGKGRVDGTFTLRLDGQLKGEVFQQVLTAADSSADMPFDVRFFQSFELPLELPKDAQIDSVEIHLTPKGKTHKPTKKSYPWDEIPPHRP